MNMINALRAILLVTVSFAFSLHAQESNPMITMKTSKGDITLELYPDKAPETVKNFLAYVEDKYFDGLIFHRVIKGFMIQGGGMGENMRPRSTRAPIKNEADNGLANEIGTIAMARTSDPHSATEQFFINLENNAFLNFQSKTPQGWGYAVFGKVVEGMDVVRDIGQSKTGNRGPYADVPVEAITITEVVVLP